MAQLRRDWGLDQPYTISTSVSWRTSCRTSAIPLRSLSPCARSISSAYPTRCKLGLAAFVISMLLGVPLGMLSALKPNTCLDSWQNVRAARTIDAGLLHRSGPGHHLRRGVGLAPCARQGPECVRRDPSTGGILVSGLAIPRHAGFCAWLVLLWRHAASPARVCWRL